MYVDSDLMPSDARIWIYQASRPFTEMEASILSEKTKSFLETWTAHDNDLRSSFEILYRHFLIIMIDKNYEQASGCSIDKSVHFIQSMEKEFGLSLMDRMLFAYRRYGNVEVISKNEFERRIASGEITGDTSVFNNLIQTKGELYSNWEIPLKESWHKAVIG
jgi:hypothetical protein